ncbi:hypothetical protein ACLB2K_065052 [Fragaria x ananassa]
MKMSLTKKPTNPITTNPIAVRSHLGEFCIKITPQIKTSKIQQESIEIYKEEREIGGVIFAIGLWQRLTRRMESLENSLRGSTTESMASMSSFLRANLREKKKKKKKKKIWEICIYLVHHVICRREQGTNQLNDFPQSEDTHEADDGWRSQDVAWGTKFALHEEKRDSRYGWLPPFASHVEGSSHGLCGYQGGDVS